MQRLCYIANIRFPTERAHGIQVAKMCEAFAKKGLEITLLVPDRKTIAEDSYAYYGVESNFKIEKIRVPETVALGKAGFLLESVVFASRAAKRARQVADIVYTREELPLLFLKRRTLFYEAHQLRRSHFFRWLVRRAKGIIAISNGLKKAIVSIGYPETRMLVVHDGYDEKQFAEHISKAEARARLGLPPEGEIAMYIGGLEDWKGGETLCMAAAGLKLEGISVAIIGGTVQEAAALNKKYRDVIFLGARPYRELSQNQEAADVLVIPNSRTTKLGSVYTSPLKLFAHMASGIPLVLSDVPTLREVVTEHEALFFTPDDPESLTQAIRAVLSDRAVSQRASQAAHTVEAYTWTKRAEKICSFIAE